MSMTIIVLKEAGRFRGQLYIDNDLLYTSKSHPRPGCATREVMNWMQIQYGIPNTVTLELEWE